MLRTLSALTWLSASIVPLLVALSASTARGDGPAASPMTVHLEYVREPAARSCAAPEQLARGVEQRLGRGVFVSRKEADITARVSARHVRGQFEIDIELLGREQQRLGRRELSTRARHCSALDDSLALVLALAVDRAREPRVAVPRANEAPSSTSAVALETPLVISETTHAPRRGWALLPSAGMTLARGLFPSIALGFDLGLELRAPGFWPVTLRGTGWPTRRQDIAQASGRAATFSARTLALGVCPAGARFGRFDAVLCAVEWLGRVDARGLGFDQAERNGGWLAAAGAAPAVAYRLGPLSVSLSAALLVPLVRRRYFFDNGADITLYQQPWLVAAGALRLGAEL